MGLCVNISSLKIIVKKLSIHAGGCGSASDGCGVFTGIANFKDSEKAERRSL